MSTSADAQTEFMECAKGFSDAEWDEAEATAYIAHVLCGDLRPENEARFVLAALEKKRANPSAPGIELLNAGLVALGKPLIGRPTTKKKKARGKLCGSGV